MATIALFSIIPGIIVALLKYNTKLQTYLLLLLLLSIHSGLEADFRLNTFNNVLTNINLIAGSAIWLVAYLTMKLALRCIFPKPLLKFYFIIFFVLGFFLMVSQLINKQSLDDGSNSGYFVLPLLPLVMYYFPKYKYQILAIVFIALLATIKRSSIIIIVLSILWISFCWQKKIIKTKIPKPVIAVAFVFLIFSVALFGETYIDGIVNRFSGISEDGGSHRDLIYIDAFNIITNADLKHLLLGYGPRYFWYHNTTITSAHNDFLEITISCGIFGLILFLLIHKQLILWLIKLVKRKDPLAILMGISYISFFVWNCVGSQFAYQSGAIGVCLFWALVENYIRQYEKNTLRCHLR